MKTTYKRIDLKERIIIEKSLALGHTYEQIAVSIGYFQNRCDAMEHFIKMKSNELYDRHVMALLKCPN